MEIANEETAFQSFSDTSVECGCGFEAVSPDTDAVQKMFELHECYYPDSIGYATTWHESLGRLLTNIVGWGVIGIVLYTLITGLLS